ncbi:single-stranded-DNA-specific exonuclease RecJ [Microcystis sp. M061S2]|uniref:single-stranded-DNA-specific exonuclease RecJ n=1 Tax=Microcystis sp. M061S2 TaxID=2771171 RepID=UPI002585FE25|nr:single-stranded-DNA-specific exonuclease RecJ [Microcystis sp. M061S2]MCA2655504.1 single-stranded-DNA-specific exonuclease RecJ [Microcystis sp. M061S2]
MSNWQIPPSVELPQEFLKIVEDYTPESDGSVVAQILWHRGVRDVVTLGTFLDEKAYQSKTPFDFGQEMNFAVKRLQKALNKGEKVTIWGDFDADGVTATSVLWEGLGQFFPPYQQLDYYIPDRQKESHGLNCPGIEKLAHQGTSLIVTCDTGSTNIAEIDYANSLGIDIIITDHHTLPDERPEVIALINPRYFVETHPFYHLSGVAVAYKLVEAMYLTLADIPRKPLENLLDLVAIGLIADLVKLTGECRYLAQKGIQKLQNTQRLGVKKLLDLCNKTGDRPLDISFGIGPRINAISRIYGDARFCVELLTSEDEKRCHELAEQAELANIRRQEIQRDIIKQVQKKLERIDLSTTNVIILDDPQWMAGILGLVAGQIAQEYQRPTILLSTSEPPFAKGSARSIREIDLYQLVSSQSHLLHRFGGHPLAAGLSLTIENLPLFIEGINQQLRRTGIDLTSLSSQIEVDAVVTVSQLGKSLFRELKLLEPCGMGNPTPKLLIQNCYFQNLWHKNLEDFKGKKIAYPRTTFEIWDSSIEQGFPGMWWGHHKDEIAADTRYDAVVELDFNTYKNRYEVRLIALQTYQQQSLTYSNKKDFLIDNRHREISQEVSQLNPLFLWECPRDWTKLSREYQQAILRDKKLVLAYASPLKKSAHTTWINLVGIGKYLARTKTSISRQQLQKRLNLSYHTLELGLISLAENGFKVKKNQENLSFELINHEAKINKIEQFLEAVALENFLQQYFATVPLEILQAILNHEDSIDF